MSAAVNLREHVLAVVRKRGPTSANAVVEMIGKRKTDVLEALRALEAAGEVERTGSGYEAVPVAQEPVPRPLTAGHLREPTCRDPEHWDRDWAMPGASVWICGVCYPPSAALRATYPLTFRVGGVGGGPPEPVTLADAIDAWQRRADR
jgi:hypothetical protein